jgi:hypothetical protein
MELPSVGCPSPSGALQDVDLDRRLAVAAVEDLRLLGGDRGVALMSLVITPRVSTPG